MRLKQYTIVHDEPEYVDIFIDETKISGYFITDDNYQDDSVNVYFDGIQLTVKAERHLMSYLIDKDWH